MLHIPDGGGDMSINSRKRMAQVLLSLALEGPMTIYGLAKFISRYTGEPFQSVRVILYRVLPLLFKHNLVEIKKNGRRNQVDITIAGFSELFNGFNDKKASLDTDLLIAYSLEKRHDVNGLLFIISLYNHPFYYDFLKDPFYPTLVLDTRSIRVVYNWNKHHDMVMLKELKINYDYILNNLSDYYEPVLDEDYPYSKDETLKLSLEPFLATEYLLRLYIEKELLVMSFRFFEDYGEILKRVLSKIFLSSFSTDLILLYDQIRIYELLKERGYTSLVEDMIFLPNYDVIKKIKFDIEEYFLKEAEIKNKVLKKLMERKKRTRY